MEGVEGGGARPTSLSDWGVYIAGVASVLIWLLKALADRSKTDQKARHRDRSALLTRALWNFAPQQPGDRTLRLVAWMRLVCVGVLLSGFALATLPRFVGGDLALLASLIVIVAWSLYLVAWRWNDRRQRTSELHACACMHARMRACAHVCVCVCVCVQAHLRSRRVYRMLMS